MSMSCHRHQVPRRRLAVAFGPQFAHRLARTAGAGIAIDVIVIYALTVHGKKIKAEYGWRGEEYYGPAES